MLILNNDEIQHVLKMRDCIEAMEAAFSEIEDNEISGLASILKDVLARLYHGLENPDFNYTIRTAPCENRYVRYYHWYVSVIPRLTKVAGFELGSGFFVNVTLPEAGAEFLRNVKLPREEPLSEARKGAGGECG